MGKTIVVDEDDLRRIVRDILSENKAVSLDYIVSANTGNDELITSIEGISKLFNCSIPTAQKIKNSVPEIYRQVDNTFAIPRSVLLSSNAELEKKKYKRDKLK